VIIISHKSALEYWRLFGGGAKKRCRAVLPADPPNIANFENTSIDLLTRPVDILIAGKKARQANPLLRQHIFSGQTPAGSFERIGKEPAVSSPEFCLYQLASELSLIQLIELAYEFCGSYALPPVLRGSVEHHDIEPAEKGFSDRESLTDTTKLLAFTEGMKGVQGQRKLKRALRYTLERSASPMETKLAMLLTLPFKLGGYGFIQPELNYRIVPTSQARSSVSKNFYSCDLYWPDYLLAVEYDSDLFHTGSERISTDSKKRNSLATLGITVITVTKKQLLDVKEFDKVAKQLATQMERRIQFTNPDFVKARWELRQQILS
jgi:hypothetical protein